MSNSVSVPLQMGDGDARAPDDPLVTAFHAARGRGALKAVTEMEKYFTPVEMAGFGRALAASDHPDREALLRRRSFADLRAARSLQPFRRDDLGPDVSFYSDGNPAAGKTLIIGFGGMSGQLGLPVGNILQALDAARTDVVMLRDPLQRTFRFGISSFAPDFAALVARLRTRFRPESYRRLVTIGNSMGATAALRSGFWLGAERAIGLGTRLTHDDIMLILGREVGPAFDPFCDCLRHRPHRGLLVYADGCGFDVEAAGRMEALGAGRRVAFAGIAEHNLIARFWAIGELAAFLGLLLEAPLPRDRDAAAPPVVIGRTWGPRLRAGLKRRLARLTGRGRGRVARPKR
ncbi:hypothetical protein [Frigidibacter sp. ROC022]|uniref:hypothetical protein n=1 Tax=Frigidibacter sp. ROC022 TaxID=2971796 RepID=UPI00215B39C2|nr:hypothetical protein [Frigidibacter sp. ROC022]MCR8725579.1 hypothetical protein [Frigidibacter sp. ROC022]